MSSFVQDAKSTFALGGGREIVDSKIANVNFWRILIYKHLKFMMMM